MPKVAVVTGANRGIGFEIARQLARRGMRVVLTSRDKEKGKVAQMGTMAPSYRISKTALNAVTRIVAAELRGTNILINSMCPGWVRTDMGGHNAPRSVEEGADTAVWLAQLPDDGPGGRFFRDRKAMDW